MTGFWTLRSCLSLYFILPAQEIYVRDCVAVKSGRKKPYIAKVASLWQETGKVVQVWGLFRATSSDHSVGNHLFCNTATNYAILQLINIYAILLFILHLLISKYTVAALKFDLLLNIQRTCRNVERLFWETANFCKHGIVLNSLCNI